MRAKGSRVKTSTLDDHIVKMPLIVDFAWKGSPPPPFSTLLFQHISEELHSSFYLNPSIQKYHTISGLSL